MKSIRLIQCLRLLLLGYLGLNSFEIANAQLLYTQAPQTVDELSKNRAKIIRKADEILKSYVLLSVADKKLLEVTKDKHDYVSMASYWWPDPKKENGLPYIHKDGSYNPEIKERYSDFVEMADLASRVKSLGEAYFISDDQKYLREAEKYLKVWFIDAKTTMNPNLNHGQFVRGRDNGRIEGVIDTRVLIDVIEGIDFLNAKRQLNSAVYGGVKSWFQSYLEWMENSKIGRKGFSLQNNIASSYHLQRMVYHTFVGDAQTAINIFEKDINKLFEKQIGSNGEQVLELKRTDPSGYSKANLGYLEETLVFIENLKGQNDGHVNEYRNKTNKARTYIDNRFK